VPFAYYRRLSRRGQATYRRSDAIAAIPLPHPAALRPLCDELAAALVRAERAAVASASAELVLGICQDLGVKSPGVEILAVRPRRGGGELHGLYTVRDGRPPRIQVWMRTAAMGRVVAFRTFLRTLAHEVGHHLDYELLGLADSLHTRGFYRRESSLVHQLIGLSASGAGPRGSDPLSLDRREGG
jgi:hypothetical protein